MSAISEAMVLDKCRAVTESGADLLVSTDGGCLMNIGGAMTKAGSRTGHMPLPLFIKQRTEHRMEGHHGA